MILSNRLLEAIKEALNFRLAGEIEEDPDAPAVDDYKDALDWVWAEYDKRFDRLQTRLAKKGTAKQ